MSAADLQAARKELEVVFARIEADEIANGIAEIVGATCHNRHDAPARAAGRKARQQ